MGKGIAIILGLVGVALLVSAPAAAKPRGIDVTFGPIQDLKRYKPREREDEPE